MFAIIGVALLVAIIAYHNRPLRQSERPGYIVRRPDESELAKWTNINTYRST